MNQLNLPKKVYFKRGSIPVALRELTEVYHLKRALLVADTGLYLSGGVTPVKLWLNRHGMQTAECFVSAGVPDFAAIRSALPKALEFRPDAIVGVGGSNAMSAAKALWALYEQPELDFQAAAQDPTLLRTGDKAQLTLLASSFGSGLQNSPFALLRDDAGAPCRLQGQALLPLISCTDADLIASLSAAEVRAQAGELLARCLRALLAEDCCAYTAGLLAKAVELILHHLGQAESGCPAAREHLHNAGAIAGCALGNVTLPDDPAPRPAPPEQAALTACPRFGCLARELGFPDAAALAQACAAICG